WHAWYRRLGVVRPVGQLRRGRRVHRRFRHPASVRPQQGPPANRTNTSSRQPSARPGTILAPAGTRPLPPGDRRLNCALPSAAAGASLGVTLPGTSARGAVASRDQLLLEGETKGAACNANGGVC